MMGYLKNKMEKTLKYEFDTWEEYSKAMEHLEDYHDCEKCHGKIVAISMDNCGNTICGYCKQIVKYPKMKKEELEKMLSNGGNDRHSSQA